MYYVNLNLEQYVNMKFCPDLVDRRYMSTIVVGAQQKIATAGYNHSFLICDLIASLSRALTALRRFATLATRVALIMTANHNHM